MDAATIVGIAALLVGVVAAFYSRASFMSWTLTASRDQFLARRRRLREQMPLLISQAIEDCWSLRHYTSIPLITRQGWILGEPEAVESCAFLLVDVSRTDTKSMLDHSKVKSKRYWPVSSSGRRMETYHEAICEYDAPETFFNGPSYRLLDVETRENCLQLSVSRSSYFDSIDTAEVLAFEAQVQWNQSGARRIRGPYRKRIGKPFDFQNRCAVPGVNTLTIRNAPSGATFYMHNREQVSTGQGTSHVIPAGEFQPSDESEDAWTAELSLWTTIIREYVEEFLGAEDAVQSWGAPIDFDNDLPYSLLSQARATGAIHPWFLGIGLHPLTWKPEILTVCVFESDAFDSIFGSNKMAGLPSEGRWKLPSRTQNSAGVFPGWPFDERRVTEFSSSPATLPAGRACLSLAWKNRDRLGIRSA